MIDTLKTFDLSTCLLLIFNPVLTNYPISLLISLQKAFQKYFSLSSAVRVLVEGLGRVKTNNPQRKLTQKHKYEEYFEVAYNFL